MLVSGSNFQVNVWKALLIPCHRVICNNGDITGYHWGNTRKQAILAWEAARRDAAP